MALFLFYCPFFFSKKKIQKGDLVSPWHMFVSLWTAPQVFLAWASKKKKKHHPYNFQLTLVCISHLAVCLIHMLWVMHPKVLHNPWRWLTSFSCKKRPKAWPKLSTRNTRPPVLCILPQLVSPPVCAKVLLPCEPASLIHMAQLFNLTPGLLQVLHHVLLLDSSANPRSTKNHWSPLTVTALLLTHDPPVLLCCVIIDIDIDNLTPYL